MRRRSNANPKRSCLHAVMIVIPVDHHVITSSVSVALPLYVYSPVCSKIVVTVAL